MAQDEEKIAESEWRELFRRRVIAARGNRTQEVMAELLGIKRDTYAKYEGGRKSMMPTRLLPKFCKICGITLESLISGDPPAKAEPKKNKKNKAA